MIIEKEEVVLQKFRDLAPDKQQALLTFLEFLEFQQKKQQITTAVVPPPNPLTTAAQALLTDYESNPDLLAFTALDGEAFHEQG